MPASSPFDIAVHDLVHRPGETRQRTLAFPAPERLGEGAASVPAGTSIEVDLRLEGLHEGILVTGDVGTTASGECVRCLDAVTMPVRVEFQELFAYSPDEAFDFAVRAEHVDLEPVVRDAVVLSLPFQPICQPDCPGLDPVTGEKLSGAAEERPRATDPRWAALEGFRTDETGE